MSQIKLSKWASRIDEISIGAIYEIPISVALNGRAKLLMFSGPVARDELLVVGSAVEGYAGDIYEDLTRINKEETNAVRIALKSLFSFPDSTFL